ncbi:MAG: hypothetical protein L6R37_005075 [Teloschistes peruensis]|nr:MAG: hypothetical protein L6R37_005075 [Teloschistes peruensis]
MADPPESPQGASSSSSGRLRSASVKFLESSPPSGMWHATGDVLAKAPLPSEIRSGSYSHNGWDGELQRRNSNVSEESMRRTSRQNSERLSRQNTAETPGSLTKTPTQQLDTHHESHEEMAPGAAPEDDFPGFFGRGEMSDQSYVPKSKAKRPLPIDPLEDIDNGQEEPRHFHKVGLPNKLDGSRDEKPPIKASATAKPRPSNSSSTTSIPPPLVPVGPDADGVYPNGYKFPPKHTWGESTLIGLKGFWKFTITPLGFLIVLYGLNVVAWGGMLFLLLIGGGKQYMCFPPGSHGVKDCNNINSPRRIWIEIDSQILNALFCVTGFGLIPWRFRDLYYLLKWRVGKKYDGLRKLAGIHRSWFRLPGSDTLPVDKIPGSSSNSGREFETTNPRNPSIPIPATKAPDQPLTGTRAPPTALWKLDYVIWAYVLNTFLQAVLSGFMWGLNRYDRPSWSTGLFVALACTVAGLGGLMVFQEGKRVKAVEGIPVPEAKVLKDIERGVEEKKASKGKGGGV